MKQSDLEILQHIRHNSRTNLTTISRKTGIPVSTIFDRLRAHDGTLIKKFTALVDFNRLGYPVRANVFIKVAPECRDDVKSYLLAHNQVNNIFRINNGYDYAAECVFASVREVEEFVEQLEMRFEILDKHVFHVIDEIAREKAFCSLE